MVATVAVPSPKSSILQKQNPVSLRDPNCSFLGGSSLKQLKPRNKRRDADHAISLVVPSASLATNTPTTTTTTNRGGRFYFNFTGFPFPLGPFLNRSTIRTEVCFFAFNFNLFILMFLLASFLYFFFFSLHFIGISCHLFPILNFLGFVSLLPSWLCTITLLPLSVLL